MPGAGDLDFAGHRVDGFAGRLHALYGSWVS